MKLGKITAAVAVWAVLWAASGCAGTGETAAVTEASSSAPEQTVSAGQTVPDAAGEGYDKGEVMPDFSADLTDGGVFKLSEHTGKPMFINLFATWCGPCMDEMPDIQRLYEDYGDRVEFLAVDVGGDDREAAAAFAEGKGYTFPVAYAPDGGFGSYAVEFIPQTFILDADGAVSFYLPGSSDYETFSGKLDKLLE